MVFKAGSYQHSGVYVWNLFEMWLADNFSCLEIVLNGPAAILI